MLPHAADIDAFLAEPWAGDSSKTVKEELCLLWLLAIGENMNIRRFEKVTCDNGMCCMITFTAGGKIGVLIAAETDNTVSRCS